jgi:hypothetical protein
MFAKQIKIALDIVCRWQIPSLLQLTQKQSGKNDVKVNGQEPSCIYTGAFSRISIVLEKFSHLLIPRLNGATRDGCVKTLPASHWLRICLLKRFFSEA